jgi:hypothetical protein
LKAGALLKNSSLKIEVEKTPPDQLRSSSSPRKLAVTKKIAESL